MTFGAAWLLFVCVAGCFANATPVGIATATASRTMTLFISLVSLCLAIALPGNTLDSPCQGRSNGL